jgi:hypothetical protein
VTQKIRQIFTILHGVISYNTVIFRVIAMRDSNLYILVNVFGYKHADSRESNGSSSNLVGTCPCLTFAGRL